MFYKNQLLFLLTLFCLSIFSCDFSLSSGIQFSQNGGEIEKGSAIKILCEDSDVEIYYTLDGKEPTIFSSKYLNGIKIYKDCTVKAIAVKSSLVAQIKKSPSYFLLRLAHRNSISADFTMKSLKINFDNGGIGEPVQAKSFYNGDSIQKSCLPLLTYQGYYFVGWMLDGKLFPDEFPDYKMSESIQLRAKWSKVKGIQFIPPSGTIDYQDEVKMEHPLQDAKIYYTVDGSTPSKDSTLFSVDNPIFISSETTIKAIVTKEGMADSPVFSANYSIKTYKIIFVDNKFGLSFPEISGLKKSDTISSNQLPTKENQGYRIKEWQENGVKVDPTSFVVSQNSEFTALWEPITYSVSYHNCENATNPNSVNSFTVEGPEIQLQPATKPNQVFDGWFDNPSFSSRALTSIPVGTIGNIDLYAKWMLPQVTFDPPQGAIDCQSTVTLNCAMSGANIYYSTDGTEPSTSSSTTKPYNGPIRIDKETTIKAFARKSGIADSSVSSARYTIKTYTITYNGCQSATHSNPTQFTAASEIQLQPANDPNRMFKGWFDNAQFKGSPVTKISAGTTGNKIFYAKWEDFVIQPLQTEPKIIGNSGVGLKNNDLVAFGYYPQTLKTDEVILSGASDPMMGKKGSDGYYYKEIVATPNRSGTKFGEKGNGAPIQSQTTYAFKVEPIVWRVLTEHYIDANGVDQGALLLSTKVLTNTIYHNTSNNYQNSTLRNLLNNAFFNEAFTNVNKNVIKTVAVDNSPLSTVAATNSSAQNQYACANTNDNVFVLSMNEATRSEYGFLSENDYDKGGANARTIYTSDYARAKGAYSSDGGDPPTAGWWWMRSPASDHAANARYSGGPGDVMWGHAVHEAHHGIAPAIVIKWPIQ